MPLIGFSDFDNDNDEDQKEEEQEPPHPLGFSSPWGGRRTTWMSSRLNDQMPTSQEGFFSPTSTYAFDSDDDDSDDDDSDIENFHPQQLYPPLSSFLDAKTAPTAALLRYREPKPHYDDDDDDDDNDDDDDDDFAILWQQLATRQPHPQQLLITSSSSKQSLPNYQQTKFAIDQKIQLERQRMEQEHNQMNAQVQGLVQELEQQVLTIQKARQAQEDAIQQKEESVKREKDAAQKRQQELQQRQQEAAEEKQQQQQAMAQEKQEHLQAQRQQRKQQQDQKTEYVTKAKKLVAQLVQLRASIEPFDQNKAVSKRRLGMKKIVRGKVNTLSENAGKVQEVAMEVNQAITGARQDDEPIKQGLERKDPGLTPDMARGKRYLLDLLASNTIQRVQAEGFNGPRGDGFPLAAMLAMISVENKDFVPILAAHIYTVCPTAIPSLPTPAPDASEEELMSSLGMIKDKKGEFETFDRFLSRTEVSTYIRFVLRNYITHEDTI